MVKNPPVNAGDIKDLSLIPGLGRFPGGEYGNPLWYSCLENLWTDGPGGLQSMGLQKVGHDGSDLTCFSSPDIFIAPPIPVFLNLGLS